MQILYYKKAKAYLTTQPLARRVENRATACWNLVKMHINPNLETLDKKAFVKYFTNFQGFDRAIRDVQEDCPELTSEANEEKKEILRQSKVLELGYEGGYNQKIRV